MFGSDNVCYVAENEGLSAFDSGITFTDSQVSCAGESSESSAQIQHSSGVCAACGGPLTKRWQKRACSRSCAGRLTPIRDVSGARNGNYKGGKAARPRYSREFYQCRPEVLRAQRAVQDAIRRGALVRPNTCSACATPCKPDAHHADYAAPLTVEWLCRRCRVAKNAPRKDRVSARPTRIPWTFRGRQKVSA